jgi:hypothetical protein
MQTALPKRIRKVVTFFTVQQAHDLQQLLYRINSGKGFTNDDFDGNMAAGCMDAIQTALQSNPATRCRYANKLLKEQQNTTI